MSRDFMDSTSEHDRRQAALAFLFARIDYERALFVPYGEQEFRLEGMRELLARLGDPQHRFAIVHVAGTKGKGSTAAMTAAALSAAGYRTGLYSSPHLQRIEERLAIDGEICTATEWTSLVETLQPIVAEMDQRAERSRSHESRLTYFDLITAMALVHFDRRGVRFAVLEVGMGGRLDSTNVCKPDVSVITSISFDHTRQLGNTLAAIAREKAGIVKPGVPVVSGVVEEEPRVEIERACHHADSRLLQLGRDFDFSYTPPRALEAAPANGRIDFLSRLDGREQARMGLSIGLLGRHQAANAAVALATLDELARQGWVLPDDAVRRGLAEVRWPARIEVVGRRPTVVLDTAHNVASIEALLATLDESFGAPRERLLVFATTRDKELRGMLQLLLPRFDRVIFTRYQNNPRGVPTEELAEIALDLFGREYPTGPDPASAWDAVRAVAGDDDLICITGSFFIAAELRTEMASLDSRPQAPRPVFPSPL
ncbi:MAG TPA: Mur ligase family protein [Pirellulales bacterium]|nr:Mur ligase family protein [Pirellulales bacterium]